MGVTSRLTLERLLDPANQSITLQNLGSNFNAPATAF
jgi:hypothetical protein